MARYEHLPIYKAAFDLNVYIETIVRHFSRYHKYTLGTELRSRAREIVAGIVRANNSQGQKKLAALRELREELEQVKLTIRVCVVIYHKLCGGLSLGYLTKNFIRIS